MKAKKRLNIEFFNYTRDRQIDPTADIKDYHSIPGCYRVDYFSENITDGDNDRATLKTRVLLDPGIYEVMSYGEVYLLFLWKFQPKHHDTTMGILVRKTDKPSVETVKQRYDRDLAKAEIN